MESGDPELEWSSISQPPPFVSLSPFPATVSPSPRRLSSCFTEPSRPIRAARKLAWVSLQGRIIGAEEASSAKTLASECGIVLDPKQAIAWELFSPIHRILIVAVISVAAANSKRNKQIFQLKKAVELRDLVLLSMQKKLDNLCEQVNYFKDLPEATAEKYGCHLCEQHKQLSSNFLVDTAITASNGDDMFKHKWPSASEAEPEERRMSDLSDWASSVTSSVDIQLNALAIEQDIYNLRKECEEKDAKIKDLSTFIHSSEAFGSKRIAELEDIIRRKNMTITKLKKDMLILEQKVVNLTRARRPTFSAANSNDRRLPIMADNLVYDMDSTTSPSSSDSDSGPVNKPQAPIARRPDIRVGNGENTSKEEQQLVRTKLSALPSITPSEHHHKSRSSSPLKEKSLNQTANAVSIPRPRLTSSSEHSKSRRRAVPRSKDAITPKRWV
ncbi:hypothetical protein M9H77_06202 [Catharanthus roseus]|uniref:Uncharacterized protein n=1 Tax=Catharanthus roseus TaxID=4058 RepID=A0ACC0BRR4_CATRO|nr:hypothetical protein M9H77_06202 [Catharanthus roseus]